MKMKNAKQSVEQCAPLIRTPFREWQTPALSFMMLAMSGFGSLQAAVIVVPNASFELPTTASVGINIDDWQKAAKPGYFDEGTYGFLWIQTAGLFQNTAIGASDHIDNLEGNQSAYVLAFPQVALFQELAASEAKFNVGVSYDLTLGLLGKSMPDGNSLLVSLYYRDGGNNMVTVAATPITYTAASLPSTTHLTDYQVHVTTVQAGDAWAGQNIGIKLESTFGTGAGYWDVDNVRLMAVPEPNTVVLTTLGFAGFMTMRRRLQKKS